jgi:serine/threonine-protein kinase
MGEVWKAKHRMLARPAAIKLVRPDVFGASGSEESRLMLARFEREAQATASMRSPHTIELYDFGVTADGTFYYVAELLDGFDCDALVKQFGPTPAERVIHLLHQVCDSLAEAHERELIHRDIKPANVFVCRYGRKVDFVKVLDFGLVKSRGQPGGNEIALTADGVVSGTPAFMSPEQVLGNRSIDTRSDIYAVGCLGYWLLTGELVFQGTTAMEVMTLHAHTQPSPPSGRTELVIPPSLDAVILSCLAKDPGERPQSADELSQRLDRSAQDVVAWTPMRAAGWWDVNAPANDPLHKSQ